MKNFIKVAFAVLMAFLYGCTTSTISSDYVKGTDFNQYKSFAFLPTPARDSLEFHKYNNEILMENLKQTVQSELERRGYVQNNENPDLLVLLRTMFEDKVDTVRTPATVVPYSWYGSYNYYYPDFYYRPWGYDFYRGYPNILYIEGEQIRAIPYTEGSIIIDLIERGQQKNRLIWRAWAERAVDSDEVQKDMQKDVRRIFNQEFPVSASTKE